MPESHDHTAEVLVDEKRSRTLSDNVSHEDEEKKGEEVPWADQDPMDVNEHTMITERKIPEGSKAGTKKSPPEAEPQETPQSTMITPTP